MSSFTIFKRELPFLSGSISFDQSKLFCMEGMYISPKDWHPRSKYHVCHSNIFHNLLYDKSVRKSAFFLLVELAEEECCMLPCLVNLKRQYFAYPYFIATWAFSWLQKLQSWLTLVVSETEVATSADKLN